MKVLLLILGILIWPLGALLVQRTSAATPVKTAAWIAAFLWVLLAIIPRPSPSAAPVVVQAGEQAASPTRPERPTNTPRPGPKPTPGLEERQAAQWEDFARYGQELAKPLNQSDQISRQHAAAAGIVSAATLVEFYRVTEQAERAHDGLRSQANTVRVPNEGRDFKSSVVQALGERRDAMRKLKDALDRKTVSAQAAYADSKRAVDRSSVNVATQLLKLCQGIGAQFDECTGALGWTAPATE